MINTIVVCFNLFRLLLLPGLALAYLYALRQDEYRVAAINALQMGLDTKIFTCSFLMSLFVIINHRITQFNKRLLKQGNKIELKSEKRN
ncbi:MAG: hypothetical protein ABIH39_04535 [Candidatus Margulisiibacteriota bacterium]